MSVDFNFYHYRYLFGGECRGFRFLAGPIWQTCLRLSVEIPSLFMEVRGEVSQSARGPCGQPVTGL